MFQQNSQNKIYKEAWLVLYYTLHRGISICFPLSHHDKSGFVFNIVLIHQKLFWHVPGMDLKLTLCNNLFVNQTEGYITIKFFRN